MPILYEKTRLESVASGKAYQEKEACNDTVTGSKKQPTISLNAISPLQMLKIQKDLALSCYMVASLSVLLMQN
jgi:hypothetical protein